MAISSSREQLKRLIDGPLGSVARVRPIGADGMGPVVGSSKRQIPDVRLYRF